MTKMSIIKSSSDLDNKELIPLSGSSYQKLWISSDSDTEYEENIGNDDPDNGISSLLSRSDDDFIMDIFVILA